MKAKILMFFSIIICTLGFSQTEIYFKYDKAGNQRYRGDDSNAKQTEDNNHQLVDSSVEKGIEEKFWMEVSLYPVPVKETLTIQWTGVVDELIDTVSMYQFSTTNWNFKQKNIPTVNRQIKVDMTNYYIGVYVLSFTLKDGRVYNRNIIKQ